MTLYNLSNPAFLHIFGYKLQVPWTADLAVVLAVGFLSLLYWAALPKPIPGIPYNKAAARRLLGDAPDMAKAKRVRGWMQDQFARHNSPVVQLFTFPFQRPWVYVADFREAHDVMLRRAKEFDRSGLTADCFGGIMPEFQMNMKSVDPRYKHNKDLVKDLMAPTFLNEVSAPELYEKMSSLLDLWDIKAQIANGRPFRADLDIYNWALDITMAVAFNFPRERTMVAKAIAHVSSQVQDDSAEGTDSRAEPFDFPTVPLDPELEACLYLANSVGVAFRSPLPKLAHWLYLQKPYSRAQTRIKQELIRRNIDESLKRLAQFGPEKKKPACAVDHVLSRERDRAAKRGVAPEFHKPAIYDELFGFIVGGHDTTSTTFQWWVKYMGLYPASQTRLRGALHAAHGLALAERRLPTVREITRSSTSIPYLDAMIEEAFRYSHIVPFVTREAVVDTHLLGHRIPKGTQVMFVTSAESFVKAAFDIDASKRAATTAKDGNEEMRYGVWNPGDVGEFKPERWLSAAKEATPGHAVDGYSAHAVARQEVFNPRAGPVLAFGAGPRGCFGRRLAYLEMRIAITLLIWAFEFLDMSAELNNLESIDTSTEAPKDCFIRLRKIEY